VRVAFHAPLKPPDHPVPSGDRRMARAFMALLGRLGHEVTLATRFRSYDRSGDAARQERLRALGRALARRIVGRTGPQPELWFTYHCYHKAPDLVGPEVTAALDVPYVIAEPSFAAKQSGGLWAVGQEAAMRAFAAADVLLTMTEDDAAGIAPLVRPPTMLLRFPPFLDAAPFRAAAASRARHRARLAAVCDLDPTRPWLLMVAMMRAGVKRRSYLALAEILDGLRDLPWQAVLIGDGEARPEIEARFAALGPARVHFLGELGAEELPAWYAAADLYVWPAFGEAYGLAMLEAQAAGLPILAFREGGVPDIVLDGRTGLLVPNRDHEGLAAALRALLGDPGRRAAMGAAALVHIRARHDMDAAAARLGQALDLAGRIRAERRWSAA
jgi:glycosyltransferase involved in cell wall biosynthesis